MNPAWVLATRNWGQGTHPSLPTETRNHGQGSHLSSALRVVRHMPLFWHGDLSVESAYGRFLANPDHQI